MAKNEVTARMRKMLEKGRLEARKRVIERGVLQFRADSETMEQLLELSENRGVPLGSMVRDWVKERLTQERNSQQETNAPGINYEALCIEVRDKLTVLENYIQQHPGK